MTMATTISSFRRHLRSTAAYNLRTLREAPLEEISGALGDLGTLLPLMIAMALGGSIDLSSTLVFSGLTNIFTGAIYGIPLPVQPMKAIAAIAISQSFNKAETAAAGLTMGIAVFFLSATGLLRWLNRVVPVPVVKGIQVGAGLSLAISAGSTLVLPLEWTHPAWDNRLWALAAFVFLIFANLFRRMPYALIVFILGLVIATATKTPTTTNPPSLHISSFWHPHTLMPSGESWRRGAVDAAIPQLPLTTLNSILAVTSLAATLFPDSPPATPSTTSIGFSVAISNLIGCWFSAMPICHGSGGLAGQYRFGARSGASIILLGIVKFLLGLFVGDKIVPLIQRFPKSLLGVMVLAAGVELAKVGQTVGGSPSSSSSSSNTSRRQKINSSSSRRGMGRRTTTRDLWEQADEDSRDGILPPRPTSSSSSTNPIDSSSSTTAAAAAAAAVVEEYAEQEARERWMVMLITAAGCLAFKNDAVGFFAGLVWHWGWRVPEWVERLRFGKKSIRLGGAGGDRQQGFGEGLEENLLRTTTREED